MKLKLNATYQEQHLAHVNTRAAGGSIAVTIPQALLKTTGLHPGDKVSFEFDAGRLIVSHVNRSRCSLQDLLAMLGRQPLLIDKCWESMPTTEGEETL